LFGFLTTEANAVVAPIHLKAMPVILVTQAEIDLWLLVDAPKALELQRPLPDDALRIVASGEKEDGPREDARALTRLQGFNLTTTPFESRQCGREADTARHDRGRRSWAESAPTRVASGRTGARAKAAIPLRAGNCLPPP
jgi:hypothetical protein